MLSIISFYLVLLLIFSLIFTLLFYKIIYRKGKRDDNRYKLFRIRDDLIFLVAKGTIKEDDFIFKTFYDMANTYIQHIHKFNLREINKAMKKVKEENHLDKTDEFVARIKEELKCKDKEVQSVVEEFFRTMLDILIRNSLTLRLAIKTYFKYYLITLITEKLKRFTKIFAVQETALKNYQIHNKIYESLATPY